MFYMHNINSFVIHYTFIKQIIMFFGNTAHILKIHRSYSPRNIIRYSYKLIKYCLIVIFSL